jgi:hypothetical protein
MHLLLPICGKDTRAQIAHQIFYLLHMEYEGSIGLGTFKKNLKKYLLISIF